MELIEGNKYNLKFNQYNYSGVYYAGVCESFCGQTCYICDRELQAGYLFMLPSTNETTYEECIGGQYKEQIAIGKSCKKKIEVNSV